MYRNKATSLVFGKCNPFATYNLRFKKIIYHRIPTQTLFLATRRDGFHLLRKFLLYRDGSVDTYCEHGGHVLQIPRILCHTNPKNCHLELVIINRIGHALTTLGHSS